MIEAKVELTFRCERCGRGTYHNTTLDKMPKQESMLDIKDIIEYLPISWGVIDQKTYCSVCLIILSQEQAGKDIYSDHIGWQIDGPTDKSRTVIGLQILHYLLGHKDYNEKELLKLLVDGGMTDNLKLTKKVMELQGKRTEYNKPEEKKETLPF